MKSPSNPMQKWQILSIVTSILSIIMIIIGVLGKNKVLDLSKSLGQKGDGYILALGIIGIMASLVIFGTVRTYLKAIDELLDGTNRLAHWQYTQTEWTHFKSTEVSLETKSNRRQVINLLLVIGGLTLFVLIYANKDFLSYLPYLIGAAGVYSVFWYLEEWKNGSVGATTAAYIPEAFFNEKGVFINNHYTQFGSGKSFGIFKNQNELSVIEFHWQIRTKKGSISNHQMRLPIPFEQEAKISDLLVTYGFKGS